MPYTRLLNELIEKSGLSAREISKRCLSEGQPMTASYISILRNESKNRVPSNDLSKVLEKVLSAEENILVLEAYLDKAPEPLIVALRNLYKITLNTTLTTFFKDLPQDQKNLVIEAANVAPLAGIVLEMAKTSDISQIQSSETTVEENIDGVIYSAKMMFDTDFPVNDDSLSPIIKKGSRVKLKLDEEYKSGDIIAYKTNDNETVKFRKMIFTENGKLMMFPFNTEYETEEYSRSDLKILGKVDSVLTKI